MNKSFNAHNITMLAFFLKIPIEDLSRPVRIENNLDIDGEVKFLHQQGLKYSVIAKKVGLSYDYVKRIGRSTKAIKEKV